MMDKSMKWYGSSIIFLLCLSFFVPASVHAQQASASVNGVVYDTSNAAIPDAQVKLSNVDTGVARTTTSNRSGTYVFLNVTPGNYTVEVERSGFSTVAQTQVKLDVDQTATFDFHLKVGQTQDTVTVQAENAGVESSSTELGTVINTKQINDLPLNGRNFTQLLTLTPGVAPVANFDQTGSGGGGFVGNQIGAFSFPSINGQRVRSNLFLLDGVNNQNTFLSTNNYSPIPDAIAEFKVQTHNDDTQFGGIIGGLINVVSKSGTNSYHGAVWEYLRNEKFDANSYFNNSQIVTSDPTSAVTYRRQPLRQNQFGGAFGGPVSVPKLYNGKDKTFFYAAYEGYRQSQLSQLRQTSASPAMRQGDFSSTCVGPGTTPEAFINGICTITGGPNAGKISSHQLFDPYSTMPDPLTAGSFIRSPFLNNKITHPLDPTALAYQSILPQGNLDTNASNLGGFYLASSTGGSTTKQDEGQIRIDQTFGSHDQIYGRYSRYYQLVDTAQTVIQRHLAPIYGNNWTVHETHTFGASAILDGYVARNYGNNEQTLVVPGGDALLAAIQKTGVSPAFLNLGSLVTAPAIGFNQGGYESIGFQQSQATGLADVWEYGANFTKVLGRHIIKVGGALETNGFFSPIRGSHETFDVNGTSGRGANLGVGGDAYASFLLGVPFNAGNRIVDEAVHGGYSDNVYVHEQWKATKNLTINAGLRYDLKLWPIYGGPGGFTGEPNPVTGQYIVNALPPNCSATVGAPCIPNGQFVNNSGAATPYNGLPPHVVVTPNSSGSIINNDYGDIAARVGLAYRVNDKMSLRAGYGRFYDTWGAVAQDAQNFNGNWPSASLELNGLNANLVTDPITNPIHLGSSGGGIVYPTIDPYHAGTWSVDPNYKTPYSDQYNFGIQQELPSNILLDMNYVGSISRRLDITDVLNVAKPGPGDPVAREPFPYMGNPWFQQSIGNANFNALEVSVNKRATQNLAFLVSYTWSKSIDDGCSGDIGAACSIQNVYDRSGDRSVSGFDLPHVFSASFTGTSPYGRDKQFINRYATTVVGGWALNGIVTLHSGTPYSIGAPGNISNICFCANTERASIIADPRLIGGGKGINDLRFKTSVVVLPAAFTFGNMPRNSLRTDSWHNTDMSLFRQFPLHLGENRFLEFRAEAFNIFNNVVFNGPNTDINNSANFGHINGSQLDAPRQIQFAAKIVF